MTLVLATSATLRQKIKINNYKRMAGIAKLYKGKFEVKNIVFTRVWAMPSPWTFSIRPVAALLEKYVGEGWNWIDPFAGKNSPAKLRNDHNPEMPAEYHLEALEFAQSVNHKWGFEGVLFDPPYSFRQISEHYKHLGMKATKWHTSMAFYEKVKSALADKIKPGGYAISFGWNTNGFGKARGFEIIEIMAIAHGGSKNDTIVTVERKVN